MWGQWFLFVSALTKKCQLRAKPHPLCISVCVHTTHVHVITPQCLFQVETPDGWRGVGPWGWQVLAQPCLPGLGVNQDQLVGPGFSLGIGHCLPSPPKGVW